MSHSSDEEREAIVKRKLEGIRIPLEEEVEARNITNYLEYVHLVHNALPELDYDDVDTSINFLNHRFSAPLLIDAITGGAPPAKELNEIFGSVVEEKGLGMVVGSQRAGLVDEGLAKTYSIAREKAPNAFIAANIGAPQLSKGISVEDVKKLVEMVKADALVVHLNPLQELVQPEGEPRFKGVLSAIKELIAKVGVPIIVKEVGSGISKEVAVKLSLIGVAAINVAGAGGTSWAAIEGRRASEVQDKEKAELAELFWDWGIPTAVSILEVRSVVNLPIIASGGIRSGIEMAKCIALGANLCAMALPMLKAAAKSKNALNDLVEKKIKELKATMFLVGAKNVEELSKARKVVTGPLARWVEG